MPVSSTTVTIDDMQAKYEQLRMSARSSPLGHDLAMEFLEMVYDAWPSIYRTLKEGAHAGT